jgi:uncharacterized protein YbaR (Trm112 family)
MHILLTDILTCPRCGPAFGLILLADRAEERRVMEGVLGCSNCREKYPIRDGIVDFGAPPEPVVQRRADADAQPPRSGWRRILGVTAGPGFLLLAAPAAAHAGAGRGSMAMWKSSRSQRDPAARVATVSPGINREHARWSAAAAGGAARQRVSP